MSDLTDNMFVYMLEQRWKILRHYFENHGNVAEYKIIFSNEPHFDIGGYISKQAKLSHLGHRKPARIH